MSDNIGNRKRNTRLVENQEEQVIYAEMRQLRDEGRSYTEIAKYLNEKRIPTRLKRNGNICSWYPSTVRNILIRSPVKINETKKP